MKKQFLFTLAILCYTFSVNAEVKTYKLDDIQFKILVPEKWQAAPGFYGNELALLGVFKNKRRPVIMVDRVKFDQYKFDENELSRSQKNFQQSRTEWVSKKNGKVIEFFPYKKIEWKKKNNIHSIGYSYILNKKTFVENYYFFKCDKKMFNIQTLATKAEFSENKTLFKKVFDSIECK